MKILQMFFFLCKQVLIVDLTLINYQVLLIEQIIKINFYFLASIEG